MQRNILEIFSAQKTTWEPRKCKRGVLWGPQCTRVHPGGQWGPWDSFPPPLSSINTQIFQKPQGSRRNTILAAASSRTTRSNLEPYPGTLPEGNTITEGFIILISVLPMMREQFTIDLQVRRQYLDGFFSLFDSQYNILLDVLGDLFDVMNFCGVCFGIR